jgi:hypothetical protein
MEITFRITPEEVASFQKYYLRKYRLRRRMGMFLLLGVAMVWAPLVLDQSFWLRLRLFGPATVLRQMLQTFLNPGALIFILVPLAFFLLLWLVVLPLRLKSHWKNSNVCRFSQTIRLQEEGAVRLSEPGDSLYRWPYVIAVDQTKSHIYIQVTKEAALIIPRRVFADEATAQRFFETAREYWQKNQSSPPPIPAPPEA